MNSERILVVYSFLTCLFLAITGIFTAKNTNQLINSFIYLPLVFFFGTRIFEHYLYRPSRSGSQTNNKALTNNDKDTQPEVKDQNRRFFLQLLGTTGLSVFIMSLFNSKARSTLFGGSSNNLSDTVSLSDSQGKTINPSEKLPTDGYSISDIDDSNPATYYSFVKNDGSWYIIQNISGNFRYTKGSGNYSSNWEIRSKLHYDYYDKVFSS